MSPEQVAAPTSVAVITAFVIGATVSDAASAGSPKLVELVRTGDVDPEQILTQQEPLTNAIDAYKAFDRRKPGWIKVELQPAASKDLEMESAAVRKRMGGVRVR